MADASPIIERILEPAGVTVQAGTPEHYPWLFSFTGEDVLEITSWNAAAGVRLTMQGRVHAGPGQIVPFQASHTPATNRSAVTTVHTIPAGELLNVLVVCDAGAPLMGQTFVRVAVRRGAGAAFIRLGILIQGPVTASSARAFPGSPVIGPFEGEPALRNIVGTQPAAGAAVLETCPTWARWELVTVFLTLTTSVAIGNRRVTLELLFGGVRAYFALSGDNQIPNQVVTYSFGKNLTAVNDTAHATFSVPFPDKVMMLAGDVVKIFGQVIQAADQFSAPVYQVCEWLDV